MTSWRRLAAALALSAAAAAPASPQTPAPSNVEGAAPSRVEGVDAPLAVLDIPYVPQSEALCGGAAAAMVMRYWGARDVVAEDFSPLVNPDGSGIRVGALTAAVRARGWDAVALEGSDAVVREQLAKRRPVIALVSVGRNRYHFIVIAAWSETGIVAHDPARAPDRVYKPAEFEAAWSKARRSMIVIVPGRNVDTPSSESRAATPAAAPLTTCDRLVAVAVESARDGRGDARKVLADAVSECPASAPARRELAGYELLHGSHAQAVELARKAARLDPADAHAWYLLGAASYLEHDQLGALDAWNHIGEPRLDLVRVDGLANGSFQSVASVIGIDHGSLVTSDAFARAHRRVADLPAIAASRVDLQPQGAGAAQIDVGVVERSTLPHGATEAALVAARAIVDREVAETFSNVAGGGDAWTASWRWWENRPRVAVSFAAPGLLGTHAVWRVDGSWAAESYAPEGGALVREERAHAALGASDWLTARWRWEARSGIDRWANRGAFISVGGAIERRSADDRLTLRAGADAWAGASWFGRAAAGAAWQSKTATVGWRALASAGAGVTSSAAPFDLWPGAGAGHARDALLRAHPLLDGGVITGPAFGRALEHASLSIERWPSTARLWAIGAAAFVDAAAAQHRMFDRKSASFADAGAGLRVKAAWLPGVLRVDYAHGLTDGADAVSVGWMVK